MTVSLFQKYPVYPRFRTLELAPETPHQQGEDVWALQKALMACSFNLLHGSDGDLGAETSAAIRAAQATLRFDGVALAVDGRAGGKTQGALAMKLADAVTRGVSLASGALRGQLEHESGFRLGNYSPLRTDPDATQDWQPVVLRGMSFDAGVAQRNSGLYPLDQGFNPALAIRALGERIKLHFDLFEGVSTRRRWVLAQGSWNAPAFACYLAKQEGATKVVTGQTRKPTPEQLITFEQYMASVSSYLVMA
jgi:hypothetical protein